MVFFSSSIKGMKDTYYMIFIHPPFAWVSYILFVASAWKGYKYLKTNDVHDSIKSYSLMLIGFIFIIYAAVSGMAWGKLYWGDIGMANLDPKFVSIIFVLIIYSAYFILRNSIENTISKFRISTIYAIICLPFATFFIFVLPRLTFSLHPNNPIFRFKESSGLAFGNINMLTLLLMFSGVLMLAIEIYKIQYRINKVEYELEEIYE